VYCPDFNGVSGWIPVSYLTQSDINTYKVLRNYSSFEIDAKIDEVVYILEETSGWAWIEKNRGEKGWIPLENLEKAS